MRRTVERTRNSAPDYSKFDASAESRPIIRLAIAVAFICCLVVPVGWAYGAHRVTGFGNDDYAMPPLTAISLLGVMMAMIAAMRRMTVAAIFLLVLPFAIVATTMIHDLSDIALGIDIYVFAEQVMQQLGIATGRPSTVAAVTIALLALATLASLKRGRRYSQSVLMLASLSLSIAAIAGSAVSLGAAPLNAITQHALLPVPVAITVVALSIAFIVWQQGEGWPDLRSTNRTEGRTVRIIFALCMFAPIVFGLTRLWMSRHTDITRELAEVLQASAHIAISVATLFWAWSRITQSNAKRLELTRALDSAPIALTNLHGEIKHWSKGCEQLYGWTADEALGRIKHELLRSERPERWGGLTDRLLRDFSSEREVAERRRDGTILNILEQARILRAGAESEPLVVLSMTDITARTRTEEALRASDARLALAVEAHEIGIFEWDVVRDVVSLSPDALRLTNHPPAPLFTGMTAWRRYLRSQFESQLFPDERTIIEQRLPRFSFHLHATQPDGARRIIEGSARCIRSSDGTLESMIGVMFDASEREQRAAALEARESELRSILETVPDAMMTVDEQGAVRSFSSTAERLFGYHAKEIIGRNVRQLMPERAQEKHNFLFARHLATGAAYLDGRTQRLMAVRSDGSEFPVELAVGQAHIGRERIFTAFVRDLSDQLAAQARLAELNDDLLHVSRLSAMGEMAAGLAHELNQPLAAAANFLGAAEMLLAEDGADAYQVRRLVALGAEQALRAGTIIKRVRTFASKGEVATHVESVAAIITDTVDLVVTGVERQRVAIHYGFDPVCPLILADRVQIQQVLVNLIRNALEALNGHIGHPPEIRLQSRATQGDMVEIMVADNGPGIAREIIERLYEPFVSTKAHGMGIGLSICRRIIESHGGQFLAENRSEGGAAIRFTIPAITETETAAA